MDESIEVIARGVWVESGQLLICRNVKHGHRFLPGGHVEFDEPGERALAREMREEAGVRVTVGEPLGVFESRFTQKNRRKHEINLIYSIAGRSGSRSLRHSPATPARRAPSSSVRFSRLSPPFPPPIQSREPHITFEWIPLTRLARARLLPAGIAQWVITHVPRGTA